MNDLLKSVAFLFMKLLRQINGPKLICMYLVIMELEHWLPMILGIKFLGMWIFIYPESYDMDFGPTCTIDRQQTKARWVVESLAV